MYDIWPVAHRSIFSQKNLNMIKTLKERNDFVFIAGLVLCACSKYWFSWNLIFVAIPLISILQTFFYFSISSQNLVMDFVKIHLGISHWFSWNFKREKFCSCFCGYSPCWFINERKKRQSRIKKNTHPHNSFRLLNFFELLFNTLNRCKGNHQKDWENRFR